MTDVLCLRPKADFTKLGVKTREGLSVRYLASDDPDLATAIAVARALIIPAVGPNLDTALFDGSGVQLVQVTGAGVDRVQIDEMAVRGIAVANVPGGSNDAVAEYVVTAASALRRRMFEGTEAIRTGNYTAFRAAMVGEGVDQLNGLTAGVIGFGTIGQSVAMRLHAAGAGITFHDPANPNSPAAAAIGAVMMDLDSLLAASDLVTLHVPLLPSTRNLIDAGRLAQMRPDAILVNAARGGIVDEAALCNALTEGWLAGAAVDVFSVEPPGQDNPLLALRGEAARRLILTPHIAGVTRQAWATLFQKAWDNVARVLMDGAPAHHVVNAVG